MRWTVHEFKLQTGHPRDSQAVQVCIVGGHHKDREPLRPHPQQLNIGPGVLVVGRVDHLNPVHHRGSIQKGLFEFDGLPFGKWWLGVTRNCHFSRLTLNYHYSEKIKKNHNNYFKKCLMNNIPLIRKILSYFLLCYYFLLNSNSVQQVKCMPKQRLFNFCQKVTNTMGIFQYVEE